MTHVTPVCTDYMNCVLMNAMFNAEPADIITGFGFAIIVVSLMVAYMYASRWSQDRKRRR